MSSSQGSPRRGQWSAEDPSSRYGPLVGLVVVDVQNDFADPAGSLCVKGGSEIVPLVNAEIERALEAGGAIVYTQDWHPAHTPHFAADVASAGSLRPGDLGRAAACGAVGARADRPQGCPRRRRLLGLFDAGPGGRRSNPDGTRGRGWPAPESSEFVVCGLATDYCVKATALGRPATGLRSGPACGRGSGGRPLAGRRLAGPRRAGGAGVVLIGDGTGAR